MSAEHWLGDVGDLRSDPVVDVFVDRANAGQSVSVADQLIYSAILLYGDQLAHMLDGAYPTDPAQYTATAGPA